MATDTAMNYARLLVDDMPENLPNHAVVQGQTHKRRPRYYGTHPRRFQDKYKEHNPQRYPDTFRKVIESGKTPAGAHRSIMTDEVIEVLDPQPGELAVDCTLGYGGHARTLLQRLLPGGRLIGLDQDPIEMPKTEARLRAAGFGCESFTACRGNFAGLSKVLAGQEVFAVDIIFADLGVSSMQIDDPKRGFSFKCEGPLDMRMNPDKGRPAWMLLQSVTPIELIELLRDNADEPFADRLGQALAGLSLSTTNALTTAIRATLPCCNEEQVELSTRRTFQALRIAVNDEFSALEALLRQVPLCLRPGGRIAVLSFHSGEDRRVKKAFASGLRAGVYGEIAREPITPSAAERHGNPRSSAAKLRWARAASAPR